MSVCRPCDLYGSYPFYNRLNKGDWEKSVQARYTPAVSRLPTIAGRLIRWYQIHGRDLPWRRTTDPYRILISEIMLQQTQVERVLGFYFAFLERFPSVRALAEAPESEVLAAWRGLGYYNRARNLHRAAQAILRQHGGEFPRSLEALQALPGVGRYTAGAIMSFAFCEDAPIVDTNVVRVLTRSLGEPEGVTPAGRERWLWEQATAIIPEGQGFVLNQALMDFGATLCTHHHPACESCPLADICVTRGRELAHQPSLFGRTGDTSFVPGTS